MKKLPAVLLSVLVAAAFIFTSGHVAAESSLDSLLKPYLSKYGLPAVSAAVVKNGRIIAAGAVGTRRAGTQTPVTINDRFHIGSDTKAMTSLLAAMMVEEGKLRWDSTMTEIFPELKDKMGPRLRTVTLLQLLSHTSGLPTDNDEVFKVYAEAMMQDGNLDELRYWVVTQFSKKPLQSDPGKNFAYSNTGYIIVGAMIERVSGKTWDELITERIFKPLKLKTAGLGPQSLVGRIDAPVGHAEVKGKLKAFLAGPNGDGPIIMGPAGLAHMSVLDFARWAGWNAGEGKRGPALVKAATLKKMHTPVFTMPEPKEPPPPGTPRGGKYALGWGQITVDWAPYPLIYHGGSNSMNLAHIWVDPKKDAALVVMTNLGGKKANEAVVELEGVLYRKYVK